MKEKGGKLREVRVPLSTLSEASIALATLDGSREHMQSSSDRGLISAEPSPTAAAPTPRTSNFLRSSLSIKEPLAGRVSALGFGRLDRKAEGGDSDATHQVRPIE